MGKDGGVSVGLWVGFWSNRFFGWMREQLVSECMGVAIRTFHSRWFTQTVSEHSFSMHAVLFCLFAARPAADGLCTLLIQPIDDAITDRTPGKDLTEAVLFLLQMMSA